MRLSATEFPSFSIFFAPKDPILTAKQTSSHFPVIPFSISTPKLLPFSSTQAMGAQKTQNPSSKSPQVNLNIVFFRSLPKFLQFLVSHISKLFSGFHQIDLLSLLQLVPKRTTSPFRFRSHVRTLSNILFEDLHRRFKQLFFFDRNQVWKCGPANFDSKVLFGCFEIVMSLIRICCGRKLGHCF